MAPANSRQSRLTFAIWQNAEMSEFLEAQGAPAKSNQRSRSRSHPIRLFQDWFQDAVHAGIKEPTAMTLATVDSAGSPDARMVLLKCVDERGFVFYTNLGSAKARALFHEPRVALCFYWDKIDKQVRVRGRTVQVSDGEADTYFATRPRLSQLGAWASKQSQPMDSYFELETEVVKTIARFGVGKVPRPPFWSGFRVAPEQIEFWKQKPFRRHERILYTRAADGWKKQWLYP